MRRRFRAGIVLLSLILLASACRQPQDNNGLIKITLQADWYPQPEHGGFYTALAKGYYKEEGLDVNILSGGPYLSPYQQVSAGGAQFGMGSSDRILESIADGQPLIAVAATMQHDPQGIMVRKESPVQTFSDLNGHTVAVQAGSTWFRYLAKRYQLKDVREIPATMSVANFIADPNYIQQAFATSEPFFASQAGVEARVLLVSEAGYAPYRVMFTTRAFLQQHPGTVAKFVHASLRGWRDYMKDPAAAHAAVAKLNPALSPQWMQFTWQELCKGSFVTGEDASRARLGQMDPARWNTLYKQLRDLGVVEKDLDPATAYTSQFLQFE
jgi:NitT/TauT family transport system substrate-binding protein